MVANGPPNGGNGGNGGSVWLEVDDNETSLSCVKRQLKARSGGNGQGKSMHGAGGKDLTVKVPKGTIVREIMPEQSPTSEIPEKGFLNTLVNEIERDQREYRQSKESWFVHYPQWEDRNELSKVRLPPEFKAFKWELDHPQQLHIDLTEHGQRALVARGGLGGLGNPHFISPTERQPHYALRGLPGQRRIIELELKTIADVGLVGMPNAGKSTFLSAVSNAHPKIAPYPFTTLNPYIGTVDFRDTFQLTIADIPGLVPGAHKNIGLGHSFLRHIERSRVLVYIVDVSGEAPWNDLLALQQELDLYHKGLSSRPSLVIANKADTGEVARKNFEQWQQQTSIPTSKQSEGGENASGNGTSSADEAVVVQSAVLLTKDATHERRADHALWLLNNLHVPLSLSEMDNQFYEIIDVMPISHHANSLSAANGTSRHHSTPALHSHGRGLPHRAEYSAGIRTDSDISQLEESLDRKYKFTEDTVFWTIYTEYNVVFIIDMSQSMYSLDPNTNNIHIQTALETLEKCLMGMIQPFTVHSTLGLPNYVIEPHICASVVGYCPRPPGSYPIERGRKKLPFCRTLAHAHMVTREGIPDFMKSIRNFMFNYECEIQDSLGSFPPPAPPIPLDSSPNSDSYQDQSPNGFKSRRSHGSMPFETASGKRPQKGDTFTFKYDPDAPLLHTLQIADYFLKVMPEVCSPAFVYLTDGVMRSNFAISKAHAVTSSLARRNTRCTFIQVGSCGGFTPETTLGFVGDNELLLYLAASLDGSFIYASDCPDVVLPQQVNFYHQVMLIKETRLARTPVRQRYDLTTFGGRRLGDMPRERLDTKKESGLQAAASRDTGFPWCSECKPPVVDTVTAHYTDYPIPVNISMLIEARMNEGFTVRSIQVYKLDREGQAERLNIKMELVWHPNIIIIYRINNTHYMGHSNNEDTTQPEPDKSPEGDDTPAIEDRGQRDANMVDIVIRSYKLFTSAFLHCRQTNYKKGEPSNKAARLHAFLKSIVEKDEQLRRIYTLPPALSGSARMRSKHSPPVFVPPVIKTAAGPSRSGNETIPLAIRVFTDEVDPSVFLKYTSWGPHHWYLYDLVMQQARPSVLFKSLANFRHTASMFIDSDLILSYVDGINFTETAKHGQRVLNDFRAHVCQAGTWALLEKEEGTSIVFLRDSFRQSHSIPVFVIAHWQMATNWILRVTFNLFNGTADARKIVMDCLPTFSDSFRPEYRSSSSESVARATRPLHLLPVDQDISSEVASNLLSTRDIGDLHTYVVEWRWTYLAREGRREDLSGEGSDREIVQQALHRLAMTLGFHRLAQDFTLLNAKGESTGLLNSPGSSQYDTCLTFYHEREGYDTEELLLACQYQIVVDMKQSSVTARTWIEPWSARFIRTVFEDDFRLLAPLGTFQQILQPERCFQLKVPNLAEFQSRRMNMFSIMAVVNSSRVALRTLQMPDISPAYAIWNPTDDVDDVKVDDPTYEIVHEPDSDEEVEIQELDTEGNIISRTRGNVYYKTHDREEAKQLVRAHKLRMEYVGPPPERKQKNSERRATLLERFMLTLFDKNEEYKYDPHIQEYRSNEYNPFILALINPGHPRKLFFNKRSITWMSTGEFTTVAYRCFLEFALFKHCDAISVNAERFNKLRFASSIISELTDHIPGLHQAQGVPNALDEHLYMDKWYVFRLPNNSSFLMVILPNVSLSSPNRRHTQQMDESEHASEAEASYDSAADSTGRRRADSEPASPPVFTPALEDSIRGQFGNVRTTRAMAINAYTLVMECSMDNAEMRRQVHVLDAQSYGAVKTTLNLRPLDVQCDDTKVPGEALQGFVGQRDVPIPFTRYALEEIKRLERMYSETYLQTIYLALLLKRDVAVDDLVACQQSTLWKRRTIDVDITAFLHSQDVARINRDSEWQAQDRQSLQDKFSELLCESFTPLAYDVDPAQGRYYFCRTARDQRSELEICLQLAQNPLFINLQCSLEVLAADGGHEKRLNMRMDGLPLSLARLCEQAGIPWRPPIDHFEPLSNVRAIMHVNCLYLPDDSQETCNEESAPTGESLLETKPDKQQLSSRSARLFQKTMSLSSLVTNAFDPIALSGAPVDPDRLPSAEIAKQHTNAQMATLQGLPHDQLALVRHCHRRVVRFIAQETLHALRDIRPATVPLLNQVWHTIATTVDDEVPSDKFEFSHNRIDLKFLIPSPDSSRLRHAMDLVMAELLRQEDERVEHPIGRLRQLGGILYMRDVRSCSDRMQVRAQSHEHEVSDSIVTADGKVVDRAIPSWFLIRPTAALDGVRILTHNYSAVTTEAADNVLAATRQLLMVALKAANTRLLLEQMAESHKFPDQLVLPDAARNVSASRMGSHAEIQSDMSLAQQQRQEASRVPVSPLAATGSSKALGDPYDIASVLKSFIPDNPDFYVCPEQFRSTFSLHPRISPNKAVQAVLASGMMNNRLVNQRNMFFVRDGDSIFYALLTIDRIPHINPFGTSESASSTSRNSSSNTSAFTPTVDAPTQETFADAVSTAPYTTPLPELFFNNAQRYSVAEDTAPSSPSTRYMSSLTHVDHSQWQTHVSEPHSLHVASTSALVSDPVISAAYGSHRLPHTVSITSMPVFDNYSLSDAIPAIHAEEKTVPCIVLHIYGVDRPRREMTQSLVQQIGERITVNVTMPEMSDMLLRRIALNDHDMNFLFPYCSPEPTILYLPLPSFVHNLNRLVQHMRQVFGDIVSPFPASDFLAKAIRRSFLHLRKHHDEANDSDEGGKAPIPIGDIVPPALRNDMSRVMDGWEYDRQTPRRVPVERMTFLYNFYTRSGSAPPPEMNDIGTGIAIIGVMPLTKERVLSKGIWEKLPAPDPALIPPRADGQTSVFDDALMISTARRSSLAPFPRTTASPASPGLNGDGPLSPTQRHAQMPTRRASCMSSPVSPNPATSPTNGSPRPAQDLSAESNEQQPALPSSEIAELFSEYLRQFKDARQHLRVDNSEFSNLTELMDEQVDEFADKPVLAVTLWSNASVRLDRLSAYVSRVYWNALGDYVSEQILYPILSAGWGHSSSSTIKLPDPYVTLNDAVNYPEESHENTRPTTVTVNLSTKAVAGVDATAQAHMALQRSRAMDLIRAPSTFTEDSKRQVHAMEIARQMAQYWGRQESVRSLRYHRQKLPRVTGISQWFSEELRGVLEALCPSMNPSLFRLLENPLVLDGDGDDDNVLTPKSLFPAYTLRAPGQRNTALDVVYDVSMLPKALKGTRQSFCIICTLPLEDIAVSTSVVSQQQSSRPGASTSSRLERTPPSTQTSSAATPSRRLESLMKRPGESGYQRPSARTSGAGSGQLHGLGVHGWSQSGDPRQRQRRYATQRNLGGKGDTLHPARRTLQVRQQQQQQQHRGASLRQGTVSLPKKQPSPSDYKPVADPEASELSKDEITHYAVQIGNQTAAIAWMFVWMVGGELEMVGYNISHRLWDSICDQIKQRLERESRRKQLLGLFASHMSGIFPGYDRQARHRGIASTWLDRDVTRDLINKFALLKQLISDDQIHYFNIDRQISPDYMKLLGLGENSPELAQLVASPPVAGMTLNDSKTELVLRQLQPDHLRWARKLTFVDYTQPYVDTQHPDTLFRIGSRFMRAYQTRILQVLRYDELMKIAERWRQLAIFNAMPTVDSRQFSMPEAASITHTSSVSSDDPRLGSRSLPARALGNKSLEYVQRQEPVQRSEGTFSVPAGGKGKAPEQAPPPGSDVAGEISLADIRRILENARLLHFVCAPLPVSSALKPGGTDRHAFERLFRVVSAMLQDLADCYIDYLCSTGYVVARRYERPCLWHDTLKQLGYTSSKISRITSALLDETRTYSYGHSSQADSSTLPSIQIPGAYLFVNTERSSLVTDVEVRPEMLSIRMHALNRFSPEWRSAVPGYVRSSISQRSIQKFTFELSKFKKLLHAKSFVYDFQLRYVASLLRPINGSEEADLNDVKQYVVYSSDSDLDASDYSSSDPELSDSDLSDSHVLSSAHLSNARQTHSRRVRRARRVQRTVAQALHIHVDLTLFMDVLSQQRYYSTRFSSRRLVRAQFPVMHREMYEYFLDHSERYFFYTDGCRPPTAQPGEERGENAQVPDLCADQALHSGCYRLYDGVLPDEVYTNDHGLGMLDDTEGFTWTSDLSDRFRLSDSYRTGRNPISIRNSVKHHLSADIVASSAPEPAWKLLHHPRGNAGAGDSLAADGSYGRRTARDDSSITSSIDAKSRLHHDGRPQMASSFVPPWASGLSGSKQSYKRGSGRVPGAAPVVTAGQYVNVHASEHPAVSSPLREGNTANLKGHNADADLPGSSSTGRMLDFALNEYSACRIHLLSTNSSVRVLLMALTPECDTCRTQSTLETQRRRQRLHSHDQQGIDTEEAAGRHLHEAEDRGEVHEHRRRHHHHRRHRKHKPAKVRAIDDVSALSGSPIAQFTRSHGRHPYHSTMASNNVPVARPSTRDGHISLQRWMSSLSADMVVDPPADGLCTATDSSSMAQMYYYLVIDMDPQTTRDLNNLGVADMRGRNGSLGPESNRSSKSPPANSSDAMRVDEIRTCEECSRLTREYGDYKMCGIHKVLQVAQVDMRDWESKGDVWANEPTILMDTSTVDPDEYDKEDPDVLLWIKRTARRLVAHTAFDYHRDFNWYRLYQHVRMADLPSNLNPRDISALVGFIERQSFIDVGKADSRVQRLLELDIPAQRIIECLQLRMRHLYLESTLLMTTLQASSTNAEPEPEHEARPSVAVSTTRRGQRHFGSLGRALASAASLNATPPATPTADGSLGLSRFSTIDRTAAAAATTTTNTDRARMPSAEPQEATSDRYASDAVNTHVLPSNPLCPIAAVDVHGRIIMERSSNNIDSVLRLLSPLHARPSRRILLDPAFQKVLGRYIRLDMIDSPWLCQQHRFPITVPVFNWSLDEPSEDPAATVGNTEPAAQQTWSNRVYTRPAYEPGRYTTSTIGSMRQRRSRMGASTAGNNASGAASVMQSPAIAVSDAGAPATGAASIHSRDGSLVASKTHGTRAESISGAESNAPADPSHADVMDVSDRFSQAQVETFPGTLLVVNPSDDEVVARLFVLNPFSYHGMLELLFVRSMDGSSVRLREIRSVVRCRRKDGLYEYERKHINMVLSTISAVVWDVVTQI
ncbi:GTPase of the mitochondrial inner membrane that associates with the large ribosomal subunit [Coemansia sp. RSA 1821]|nr:GTPase of the mitochondrial inner membrane that associates with the large ribosomal subunit [Coemansia sp. RSA 1821]